MYALVAPYWATRLNTAQVPIDAALSGKYGGKAKHDCGQVRR